MVIGLLDRHIDGLTNDATPCLEPLDHQRIERAPTSALSFVTYVTRAAKILSDWGGADPGCPRADIWTFEDERAVSSTPAYYPCIVSDWPNGDDTTNASRAGSEFKAFGKLRKNNFLRVDSIRNLAHDTLRLTFGEESQCSAWREPQVTAAMVQGWVVNFLSPTPVTSTAKQGSFITCVNRSWATSGAGPVYRFSVNIRIHRCTGTGSKLMALTPRIANTPATEGDR